MIIGIKPQIHLARFGGSTDLNATFAWDNKLLGYVVTFDDFSPSGFGNLISTIDGLAAMPAQGLEEQSTTIFSKLVHIRRCHKLCAWNCGQGRNIIS